MLRTVLVVFVILWASSAHGKVPPAVVAASTSEMVRPANAEALVARLDETNATIDRILTTVYWSLGTSITIVLVLVGYSWFANFRIYERDKSALEREINLLVNERTAALEATTRQAIEELQAASRSALLDELKRFANAQTSAIKSDVASVKEQVLMIQLDLKLEERKVWCTTQSFRNALSCGVEALSMANRLASYFEVGDILDLIAEDMSKCVGRPIDNYLIAQLVGALDGVKGHHAPSAANLKQKATGLAFPNG